MTISYGQSAVFILNLSAFMDNCMNLLLMQNKNILTGRQELLFKLLLWSQTKYALFTRSIGADMSKQTV